MLALPTCNNVQWRDGGGGGELECPRFGVEVFDYCVMLMQQKPIIVITSSDDGVFATTWLFKIMSSLIDGWLDSFTCEPQARTWGKRKGTEVRIGSAGMCLWVGWG